MGFISSALVSLVALETEEVCDWIHDSKKPLCGIHEKQGLSGTGVVVGAASGGDGGAWTRMEPRVQRSGCVSARACEVELRGLMAGSAVRGC